MGKLIDSEGGTHPTRLVMSGRKITVPIERGPHPSEFRSQEEFAQANPDGVPTPWSRDVDFSQFIEDPILCGTAVHEVLRIAHESRGFELDTHLEALYGPGWSTTGIRFHSRIVFEDLRPDIFRIMVEATEGRLRPDSRHDPALNGAWDDEYRPDEDYDPDA